jgi:RimJ/RimL family protein N-acetyltransferase
MIGNQWPDPEPRTFVGRHVTLTPFAVEEDTTELYAGSHQPESSAEMWRYVSVGPFATLADFRNWMSERKAFPDMIPFTVKDNGTGRRIGSISLMRITPAHGTAELGFIWYEPAAQRSKANTEANYLLLRHCFTDLGYRRMEWKCHAENLRSRAAALRLGYTFEGVFRQHLFVKGANRDTAWFAMLDGEWPNIGSAMERWLYEDDSLSLARLITKASGHED